MLVGEFLATFNKRLYEVAPKEIHRDLERQERVVKHSLFSVVGTTRELAKGDVVKYQESFHTKIDRMATDYKTWERGGFKSYAKPKQFVTGRVAAASKKAFDWVLHDFLTHLQRKDEERASLDRESLNLS